MTGDLAALQFLCEAWQATLGLRDWVAEVSFGNAHALGSDHSNSRIQRYLYTRHARMELLLPEQIDPTEMPGPDIERNMVHELLHLHLHLFGKDADDATPEAYALEQAINAIAHALVTLKREKVAV